MADEQTPQQPAPAAPAQVVAVPLTFLQKLEQPADVLWREYRAFFIVFGILILIVKFREVIISLLLDNAKQTINTAEKKDEQLKTQENQANDAANALRKQADDLSNNQPVVDENWNKK